MIDINEYFTSITLDENNNEIKNDYKELFSNKENAVEVICDLKRYIDNFMTENKDRVNTESDAKEEDEKNYKVSKLSEIEGEVIIGEGTTIDSFTKIAGPVIIGKNVSISTNVYIRPYTIIGDNVKIGHGSEIKESIIMDKAKVASNVFVGNSIIGKSARLGTSVVLTNRKFDQTNVIIKNNDTKESIDSKTDFFGSIIGDESRIGANCTLLPGTFIGHDTFVMAGITVSGIISSNVFLKEDKNCNVKIAVPKNKIELKD